MRKHAHSALVSALLIAGVAGSAAFAPLHAQGDGCDRKSAPALTADQKTKIKALQTEFEAANKADLDAVKAARAKAKSEREAGVSQDSARAGVAAAAGEQLERLMAARQQLQQRIDAVLTPEQRATGCYGPLATGKKRKGQ
jgi:hypothetical protein